MAERAFTSDGDGGASAKAEKTIAGPEGECAGDAPRECARAGEAVRGI